MKVWKVRQYLSALLLYVQRRLESERGFFISIRTRDVCGADKRRLHTPPPCNDEPCRGGLAKRRRRDVYLIERKAAEEVLTALRQWI